MRRPLQTGAGVLAVALLITGPVTFAYHQQAQMRNFRVVRPGVRLRQPRRGAGHPHLPGRLPPDVARGRAGGAGGDRAALVSPVGPLANVADSLRESAGTRGASAPRWPGGSERLADRLERVA